MKTIIACRGAFPFILVNRLRHVAVILGVLAGGWLFGSQSASAYFMSYDHVGDNDCSGFFGQGFDNCKVGDSPVIAGFDADLQVYETNGTYFPSVDGTEWTFDTYDDSNSIGRWSYDPDDGDPGIRYWSAKAGDGFRLYWYVDTYAEGYAGECDEAIGTLKGCLKLAATRTSGYWITPDYKALSHLTFYDTGTPPPSVPEPSATLLLAIGLLALGISAYRKATIRL